MRPVFLLFLLSNVSFGLNRVVRYEPDKVMLEGTLELQTFPGRPNYESIKGGDAAETQWYLRLDQPIDVETNPLGEGGSWEPEKGVRIVQVIIDDKDWAKRGRGKRVRATGSLFHQWSGHHHARVLFTIETMKDLESAIPQP